MPDSTPMVNVRYIVHETEPVVDFYTRHLGFEVGMHHPPGFAMLTRGGLRLLLNAPGAGGAGRAEGATPAPGGWNRVQLQVPDLDDTVTSLSQSGAAFRSGIIDGQGGRQALVEDPSGNVVELFQPHH